MADGGEATARRDDDLARRIQRGDPAAFDEFFDRHAGGLLGYLLGMVGDRATAEDLVQETMLRAYRHIHTYEERGAFRAWVFRIASNLALTELRRRRYRREESLDAGALEIADPASPDPEEARAVEHRARALQGALNTLSDGQRAVFLLRAREGLSIRGIAAALGVPEGTVKSRIHHAVRKLRESIIRHERTEPTEESHGHVR